MSLRRQRQDVVVCGRNAELVWFGQTAFSWIWVMCVELPSERRLQDLEQLLTLFGGRWTGRV